MTSIFKSHDEDCTLLGIYQRLSIVAGFIFKNRTYMMGFSVNKSNKDHRWINLHLLFFTIRVRF